MEHRPTSVGGPGPPSTLFEPLELGAALRVYLSVTGAVRALGIVRGIVLLWLMNKQEWGGYQLGLILAHAVMPLAGLGLHEGFLRFVPTYENQGQLRRFMRAAGIVAAVTVALSAIALWVSAPVIGPLLLGSLAWIGDQQLPRTEAIGLARAVSASVTGLILFHTVQCGLRGRRMFRAVSAMELLGMGGFTVVALVMALCGVDDGAVYLIAYAVICAAVAVGFGVPLFRLLPPESPSAPPALHAGALREVLRYSIWAGGAAACWQLFLSYPAWTLNRQAGPEVFATFGGMRLWTQIGLIAMGAIITAVASIVTQRWEAVGRARALALLTLANKTAAAALLAVCGVLTLCREPILLMFRSDYRQDGAAIVGILLLYHLQLGLVMFLTVRLTLIKRSAEILLCWIVGGITVVFASAMASGSATPVEALVHTAWSATAGSTMALLCALILLARHGIFPDVGTLILNAGCFLLAGPPRVVLVGGAVLLALALTTTLLFSADERRRLSGHFFDAMFARVS